MVTTQNIPFTASDGVDNALLLVQPEQAVDTIILCLPAMGVAAKNYTKLLHSFAEHGVIAASYDLRGNGNSSVRANRGNNFGYQALVKLDLPAAIKALTQRFPEHKLVLLGHSLGGQVASLYLAQHAHRISGLVLAASCTVYYRSWPRPQRWGLWLFAQVAWLISNLVGHFPGRKLGFGGKEARMLMRDWAFNARTGEYALDAKHKNTIKFKVLKDVSILAINFENDDFAPPKATEHLLAKLNSNAVTREIVTAKQLGLSVADHFNWVKQADAVSSLVQPWLDAIKTADRR